MIFGDIKYALNYCGIHPGLDIALRHLASGLPDDMGDERINIKDDDVYVFKVKLRTLPDEETFYENHHEYFDIHVVLEGEERIDIDLPENLEMYEENPGNDAYFYHGGEGQQVILRPGKFLVVFPEDAHRTCGVVKSSVRFTKAVYKVRI